MLLVFHRHFLQIYRQGKFTFFINKSQYFLFILEVEETIHTINNQKHKEILHY